MRSARIHQRWKLARAWFSFRCGVIFRGGTARRTGHGLAAGTSTTDRVEMARCSATTVRPCGKKRLVLRPADPLPWPAHTP